MKKTMAVGFVLVLLGFSLSACVGEISRIRFKGPGEKNIEFRYDGSGLEFWTDFDVEYRTKPEIFYVIKIFKEGKNVSEIICDPFVVESELMARNVKVRGITKSSYLAMMQCGGDIPEGKIKVDVQFFADEALSTIFRADLVLKESD